MKPTPLPMACVGGLAAEAAAAAARDGAAGELTVAGPYPLFQPQPWHKRPAARRSRYLINLARELCSAYDVIYAMYAPAAVPRFINDKNVCDHRTHTVIHVKKF